MTNKEILRVLNANVKRLQDQYNACGTRNIRIRLEEAKRIRNAIATQLKRDKRLTRLDKLL